MNAKLILEIFDKYTPAPEHHFPTGDPTAPCCLVQEFGLSCENPYRCWQQRQRAR